MSFQPTLAAADRNTGPIWFQELKSLALVNLAAVQRREFACAPRRAAKRCPRSGQSRPPSVPLRLYACAPVPPLRQLIGIYTYRAFRQPVIGCIRAHLLGGGAMTTILPKAKTQHLIVKKIDDETLIWGDGDVSKHGARTRSYAVSRACDCREALWLRTLAHGQPLPLPRRGDNRPMAFLRAGQAARGGRRDLLTGPRSRALEAASPTGARKEKAPRLAPVGLGGGAIGKTGLSPRRRGGDGIIRSAGGP